MTDEQPRTAELRRRHLSWVWLIPIGSLLVGAYLLWSTLSRRGPLIDIVFETAGGLEAGQSQLKFKDMRMGTVEGFDLTGDRHVVIHARMTAQAEPLLTEGAQFWVVRPGVFAGNLTGLNTLVSGSYIAMTAGEDGKPKPGRFTGLESPPADDGEHPGRLFTLTAPRIGAVSTGSPVFFRDVEVGKVVDWKLLGMEGNVTITINVRAPYDQWVHENSRFWNTSGISLKLGAEGVQLQVDSFKAAVLGGITFDTSTRFKAPQAEAGHGFALYPTEELANAAALSSLSRLATYFRGSAGGLSPGAPVMLLGFRVGTVTAVTLQYDTGDGHARVRADFVVDIERIKPAGGRPMPPFPQYWTSLVAEGLRVHLKGGNLLTGQQQLSFEIDPDAAETQVEREGDTVVLPASQEGGGGLDELLSSASSLLKKVGQIPFAAIGASLNDTLSGASGIVHDPKLKQVIAQLNGTLAAAQELVRHVDAAATPALRRLPAIADKLDATLGELRGLVSSVGAGSAGTSKFARDLDGLLVQVTDASVSVRAVADLLSRHPEALIRGRVSRSAE